ncbi:MAG TPA: response regulator transcription factor [Burkholderiales bacterium]|nr:response regulator transcription factor [Burkholderiales bacterium]
MVAVGVAFTHLSARAKEIRGVTKVFNQLLNSIAPESVESHISANHSRLYKSSMEGTLVKDLRILIVDDSETTRRILRAIIRSREWIICGEAETGRAGIRQFQKLKPDLVLIDLAMPDINGIEAARRMSILNPKTPLILFTILELEGIEKVAHEAGICAVVSKAQAWDLVKSIETAVGYIQQHGQSSQEPGPQIQ